MWRFQTFVHVEKSVGFSVYEYTVCYSAVWASGMHGKVIPVHMCEERVRVQFNAIQLEGYELQQRNNYYIACHH
jgi:hypothetical protein